MRARPTSDLVGFILEERRLDREDFGIQIRAALASAEAGRFTIAIAELAGARLVLETMQRRAHGEAEGNAVNRVVPGGGLDIPHLRRQMDAIVASAEGGYHRRAHGELNGARYILIRMRGRVEHHSQEPS